MNEKEYRLDMKQKVEIGIQKKWNEKMLFVKNRKDCKKRTK